MQQSATRIWVCIINERAGKKNKKVGKRQKENIFAVKHRVSFLSRKSSLIWCTDTLMGVYYLHIPGIQRTFAVAQAWLNLLIIHLRNSRFGIIIIG